MSNKKGGAKKGQVMNLTDFTGDKKAGSTGESLDWAEDDWEDERHQKEQELYASSGGKLFGRKAGAMDDFRSAAPEALSTVVPEDMVAPFVAHVGNLPNGITDEQLEENFAEQFVVIAVGVVKRPKATFGYVEVSTRDELQALILRTGRNIMGRKMRADVATEQQIERFKGQGKDHFSGLSRDAIGAETQPEFRQQGMGGRGMKSSGSMGDFSRDNFGNNQENGEQGGGGFGGFGSAEELGDFRSSGPVAQPPAPGMGGEGRRGGGGRGDWRNNSNSKPASPNEPSEPAGGGFGNWRDAPVQAQPEMQADDKKGDGKKAWSRKGKSDSASPTTKDAPSGGWRRDEPAEKPQAETKQEADKPAEKKPAWGPKKTIQPKPQQDKKAEPVEANRFAAFRK